MSVEVNDHYTADGGDLELRDRLMDVLDANFELSMNRSEKIVDHVMSLARAETGNS